MTHLHTPEHSPLYATLQDDAGHVPNYGRVFALAPDAFAGWLALAGAVRAGMDERRYELVTLVAARRLESRYCTLAHTAVLRNRFYDDATLHAIVRDRHRAGLLDPADVAVMDFADRIADRPAAATPADVEELRRHGLSEADILHVVLAVAIRRFFTTVLDASGAEPDPALAAVPDHLTSVE